MLDVDQKTEIVALTKEIATRQNSVEFGWDIWGLLPDMDYVLEQLGLEPKDVFPSILADSHVWACYSSRIGGVLTSEWKIEYPGGSELAARLVEQAITSLPVDDIVTHLLDAVFWGMSINEIIWKIEGGNLLPSEISQKPLHWFKFNKYNELKFISRFKEFEGIALPAYKFLVAQHQPTYEKPYGERVLSRCFWPLAFKKGGWRFWNTFLEKFGIPWLIGKVPPGTKREARDKMLEQLKKMVQDAVAVINDEESIDSLNIWNKGATGDIYSAIVNMTNAELSKAILTQTLTTQIDEKGSYAASQSHLSVRKDICKKDKKLVARYMDTLIKWICYLNFGEMENYPRFAWIEEEDPKEELSRRDSQLVQQGVRYKQEYYMRAYGLKADEFDLVEPTFGSGGFGEPGKDRADEKTRGRIQEKGDRSVAKDS